MSRLALIVLASLTALSCASTQAPTVAQSDSVLQVQAAVLATLLANRPPGRAYVVCVSGGPPSQRLLELVQPTASVHIRPCSADVSDVPLTTDRWPYRPVTRFFVGPITFSGSDEAAVQAVYGCGPLCGYGAEFTLHRQPSGSWVVTARTHEEEARLRHKRGLTPACSGLASLATDARR